MKIVVQRVKRAKVTVEEKVIGKIGTGLVLLVGFSQTDTIDQLKPFAKKVANLRVFDDENKQMNLSVLDINGKVLSISQFTLYGDTKKGNRPSYQEAMKAEEANHFYELFNKELEKYVEVETGIFQSDMQVELVNDGPVTIII